jgi:hypothetical protein
MSAANAAARKRRAAPDNNPSVMSRPANFAGSPSPSSASPQSAGLTLPQVIALIDTRLVKLETFAKESSNTNAPVSNLNQPINRELEITNNDIVFQEVDRRFEILATEINNLKDMLLKLQSYTMDVNKTLMEERVRVFSDIGNISTTSNDNLNNGFFLSDGGLSDGPEMTSMDLRNMVNEELNN